MWMKILVIFFSSLYYLLQNNILLSRIGFVLG